MESMMLKIITPDKLFFNGEVLKLKTENYDGSIGILPNHISYLSLLKPTITSFVLKNGQEKRAFTSSGILRVKKNEVEILCDSCEWPEDIDANRAKEAKKRAEDRLIKQYEKGDLDIARAEKALLRAVTRINLKKD